jgi:hypothetical protein
VVKKATGDLKFYNFFQQEYSHKKKKNKKKTLYIHSQAWWCIPIIPAVGQQEDLKFQASMDYEARLCLKEKVKQTKNCVSWHTLVISANGDGSRMGEEVVGGLL